jgi:hypothetical protein
VELEIRSTTRPGDASDITVEVKPGDNEFNFEIASK